MARVFLIHGAVGFVDDHKIEIADTEFPLPVVRLVNEPHHRRIGRDIDAALRIFLGCEISRVTTPVDAF